jgi:uncharacterized protein (DUF2252 family)
MSMDSHSSQGLKILSETSGERHEPIAFAPPWPTPAERLATGKAHRGQLPRSSHAQWKAPSNRADPIDLLEKSNHSRLRHLVPIRYGRMLQSPFNYLRGSPIVMAADLASTPVTGFRVQLCGDAHLRNFGVFASPERHLLFDINDFDETLPGPWEWDLKRLATSFYIAGRSNGFKESDCEEAAQSCGSFYRRRMREYSEMSVLDLWYSRVDAEAALAVFRESGRKDLARQLSKARQSTTLQALTKIAAVGVDGQLRLVDHPPILTHVNDDHLSELLRTLFRGYVSSLQEDRRQLLERYRFLDFALKVVGIGSVGTRCFVVLLDSSHQGDPLLLQVKEAQESVLEPYVGHSPYRNHGHRVVCGQHLMQAASDIFLGWASLGEHNCYFRILRDMKGTADVEKMCPGDLCDYADLCGWVLARAHARSGDPCLIAGYLGKGDAFDEALAKFAKAYADQTEQDYEALSAAVKSGHVVAQTGV